MVKNDQELMVKFQMFEQQIQALQQQMQAIEQGVIEMLTLRDGLDNLVGKTGSEILAPIGRGIFAKAKLLSEELTVDVGNKTFVKKSIPDTKKIIEDQIGKLEEIKNDLDKNLEEINKELTKTFMEHQSKKKGDCACGPECAGEECSDDCKC